MKFLTTGEFAKLCGTQKGTLFFYDKEGLLKPKYVSGNGYRRYGIEQFYEYDMISMFKETGSSLKEIKAHLPQREPKKLLDLFEEKKLLLERETAKLVRRQKMLDDIIKFTREALNAVYDVLEIVEMEEEALEMMPVSPEEQKNEEGYVKLSIEFARRFEIQGRYAPAPFGALFKKEDAVAGRHLAGYFFCGADSLTPPACLHIRPKGLYAVFFHSGDINSHMAAYVKTFEALEKSGRRIAGDVYAYELMSYFVTSRIDEYVIKHCIPVE